MIVKGISVWSLILYAGFKEKPLQIEPRLDVARDIHLIKTPYQRVMEDPSISGLVKGRLKKIKEGLDIVEINRAIVKLYNQLERVHRRKEG